MGDTTADSREGSQFGPYRLRRLIGRGKARSACDYATLSGLNANSTPFVWDGTASVQYQDPAWLTKPIG